MFNRFRFGLAVSFITLVLLYATSRDRCAAQTTDAPANPSGSQPPTGGQKASDGSQGKQGGTQNPAAQPAGPIVAGPGSTVVAPAPNAGNSGLIVAAPGSTVVVQQIQPAAQAAKSSTAAKTNSFSTSKNGDQATIDQLGAYAKNPNIRNILGRAGAIDALGLLGAGADDATITAIAKHLGDVLDVEFIKNNNPPAPAAPLQYRDPTGSSEFLCFHVVQAVGNLGWSARSILTQLQILRGQNPILDAAIDRAVIGMQTAPAPQKTGQNAGQGSGTPNPTQPGQ